MLRHRLSARAGPLGGQALRATAAWGSEADTLLITALHKFAVGPHSCGPQQGHSHSGLPLPSSRDGGFSSRGFAAGGVADTTFAAGAAARRSSYAVGALRQLHSGTVLLQAADPTAREQPAAADPSARDVHTKAVLTGDDAGRQARRAAKH